MTVPKLEQIVVEKRAEGFIANALIVDYDGKLRPTQHYKDKRFEFDEIYSDLCVLMSKYNLIGWTAAQTQRDTRHLKILSGDKVSEDIGKMQKVTCSLSLGKGDWTEDSYYIWVAAHKNDQMDQGCEIVPDMKSAAVYDRDATRRAMKAHGVDPNA